MSDRPHGSDWWLASNGKWYPPEAQPGNPQTAIPVPSFLTRPPPALSPGLVVATQATLATAAGIAVFAAAGLATESGRFDTEEVAAATDAIEALGAAGTIFVVAVIALLAGIVMLGVWGYQAYRAAVQRGATGTTWSPGWAAGGWLIPLANLVIPRLVVGEIDRMSHPDTGPEPIGDRWRTAPTMMLGHWWWALTVAGWFVLAFGLGVFSEQLDRSTLVEQTYRAGLQATAAGLALWAAASAVGAVMVGRIGSRLAKPPASRAAGTIH